MDEMFSKLVIDQGKKEKENPVSDFKKI